MESHDSTYEPLRPVIAWMVALCLAVAMAPWLSGGQEPLGQLLSAFALLLGTVLLARQPAVRQLKSGPLVISYYAVLGWAALSLLWSFNRYSTLEWVIGLVMAGLGFRLAYALSGEAASRRRLVGLYVVSAALFALYGLYLYITSGYDRFTSSFYWPNPAAAYLLPAVLLSYDRWRRRGHWIQIVLIGLLGTGFVLADSRATEAVALVIGIVYFFKIKKNKRFWITLVFSSGVIAAASFGALYTRHILQPTAVTTAPGSRLAPSGSGSNGASQSGNDRLEYLKSAFAIWNDHPLLGTGAGTFADVHPRYQDRVISASTSAHNIYIQTLAEQGLLGFLLMVWLLVVLAFGTLRGLWQPGRNGVLILGLAAIWLHFGLDIDAQYPAMLMLVAILGATVYHQRPVYRTLGWRPLAASILLLVPVVGLYLSDSRTQRGRIDQTNGDYDYAADDFASARDYLVYNPDVLTAEGINRYTLAQIGTKDQLSRALALARAAERQDPADAQHHELEGRILAYQQKYTAAETAFKTSLELDPYNHPEYAYDLSEAQIHAGQSDAALVTARAMLAQYPSGVIANRSTDSTVAPNLANLQVLVGTILLQRGDVSGARAAAVAALAIDKSNLRAQALETVVQRASSTEGTQ